jgi:DNA-binding transcriptional MocR family regulator
MLRDEMHYWRPYGRSLARGPKFAVRTRDSHILVWLKGKHGRMIADVHHKAAMAGVGLYTVDSFYTKPPPRTGVVLGYAPLREREIREGIQRLAAALT